MYLSFIKNIDQISSIGMSSCLCNKLVWIKYLIYAFVFKKFKYL